MTTSKAAEEALAPLLVEVVDGVAQPLDRLGQVVALGDQPLAAARDFGEFLVGAQIDGAQALALLAQALELAFDEAGFRRRRAAREARQGG